MILANSCPAVGQRVALRTERVTVRPIHLWSSSGRGDDADVLSSGDNRVLVSTRLLALVIIPFLLGAFVILYFFPQQTAQLFAWPIKPTMTSMMLASAYFGGAYFFVRVLFERRWNAIKIGLVSVILFASLLGVATVMHWEVFNHRHTTFWIWTALYFATPFLVFGAWLANCRVAGNPAAHELRLSPRARWIIGVIGLLALAQGLMMFVAPQLVMPFWPWSLTPLTCRVVGAIFCLGIAGLGVFVDSRWSSASMLLEVEMIMVSLMLVAALRALRELQPHRVLTWLLGSGFVAVLLGSIYLWVVMTTARRRTRSATDRLARTENAGLL